MYAIGSDYLALKIVEATVQRVIWVSPLYPNSGPIIRTQERSRVE